MKNNFFKDISLQKQNDIRTLRKLNSKTLIMSIADSDFEVPSFITNHIVNIVSKGDFSYNKGVKIFNQNILPHLHKKLGFNKNIDSENVFYTIGIVFSLQTSISLHTKENEYVLVTDPIYKPFLKILKNAKRKIVTINVTNNGLKFDDLRFKVKKYNIKLFLFCNPHNPTGKIFTREELLKIKEIIYKNDGFIYSDEAWADLVLSNKKYVSFANIDKTPKSRIVSIFGIAKSYLLYGLSFAYVVSNNKAIIHKFCKASIKLHYSSHKSPLVMAAIEIIYTQKGYQWIETYKNKIRENIKLLKEGLIKTKITFTMPEATYLVWLDFKKVNLTHNQIIESLNNANIILSNGISFGKSGEKKMRINLSTTNLKIKEFLTRIYKIKEFND